VAAVQPKGDAAIELGVSAASKVFVDLEELLTTRLLVQGTAARATCFASCSRKAPASSSKW
jgi:hypothetical protein